MSQRKLLSIYQNRANDIGGGAIEEALLFIATATVVIVATRHHYGYFEAAALASTVFCQIHSATTAGSIQHRTSNALGWSVAVLAIAAVRISATWLAVEEGAVAAFAIGSYAYLAAMLVLQAMTQRRAGGRFADRREASTADSPIKEGWHERLASFAFFAVGAVTFQIDKYALDGAGYAAAVAQSGALTMLLLSPISLLFATLYRTRTQALFSPALSLKAKFPVVGTIAVQFSAGAAMYIAVLLAPWPGVANLVFPFLQIPVTAILVFALAIVVDRFGTLLAFATSDWRAYRGIAAFKAATLVLVYLAIRFWMGFPTLTGVYLAYLVASVACLLLVASMMIRFKGRHTNAY